MNSSTALRLRLALQQRKYFPLLLFAAFTCLLLVNQILSRMPPTHVIEPLSKAEMELYSNDDLNDIAPGKCKIKNFSTLKRMSIVYTWVNGSQPCYREIREKAGGARAVGGSRDREIGELMYSIRSLEKNVPWHEGQIYIVSPGHIPYWLDMNNPRIKVINQDDLFPDYAKEFLPTFNTHVIEQFLYLIPGLSDIFMQINDDYIFTKPILPHEFFTCDGGIRLLHETGIISHTPPTPKKGVWISSVLNTQQEMDLRWGKQDRYYIKHAPFVYSRRAFERVHQIFDRPLYMTLKSKFRARPDMNNPLLHHYYMVSQGSRELQIPIESPPNKDLAGYKLIIMKNDNMDYLRQNFNALLDGTSPYHIVALNDEYTDPKVAELAVDFLSKFLPEPSRYEKSADAPSHPLTIRNPDTCEIDNTILAPFPKRVEAPPAYEVVAYREVQWVAFVNAFLKGFGLGLGVLIIYIFHLMCVRPRAKVKGGSTIGMTKTSQAYSKV